MNKRNPSHKRWLILAISGLLLTGFGLSLLGEAIIAKAQNESFYSWGSWGTAALLCFNTGLSLFGGAVIERYRLLQQAEQKER